MARRICCFFEAKGSHTCCSLMSFVPCTAHQSTANRVQGLRTGLRVLKAAAPMQRFLLSNPELKRAKRGKEYKQAVLPSELHGRNKERSSSTIHQNGRRTVPIEYKVRGSAKCNAKRTPIHNQQLAASHEVNIICNKLLLHRANTIERTRGRIQFACSRCRSRGSCFAAASP